MRFICKMGHCCSSKVKGAPRNAELVCARRTLRCKRLGQYKLVEATAESNHNHCCIFTILAEGTRRCPGNKRWPATGTPARKKKFKNLKLQPN
jgi:hypothetical protein